MLGTAMVRFDLSAGIVFPVEAHFLFSFLRVVVFFSCCLSVLYLSGTSIACFTPNPKAQWWGWTLETGRTQMGGLGGPALYWDPEQKPPAQGITLSNDNRTARSTSSRGTSYSCTRSEQVFSEGRYKIVLKIDDNPGDDSSLFVGMAETTRDQIENRNGSQSRMWT